jgi:hypothetical protein
MQQHNSDALIHEEHKLNKLKREEVIPRYISVSPSYYRMAQKNQKFEQRGKSMLRWNKRGRS